LAEEGKEIPFEIGRVFCISNVPTNAVRGRHANRVCSEAIFALAGRFRVTTCDGQGEKETILTPEKDGLLVGPNIWIELDQFTKDAVCLVLASGSYRRDDHIISREKLLNDQDHPG